MKELLTRSLTSILFVAVLIGCILWHPLANALLFFLFTLLACNEYFRMMGMREEASPRPSPSFGYLAGALSYAALSSYALWDRSFLLLSLPLLVPLAIVWEMFQKRELPFHRAALSLFGPLFFGTAFGILPLLRAHSEGGPFLLVGLFILIWIHDSGAYLFGKLLGKKKLWPRISPGKTWEGSALGAVLCLLTTLVIAPLLPGWSPEQMPLSLQIAFPLVVIFPGTFGDLSISLLKRSVGAKDTGWILPGHGGVLDRFDALLMSTPFFLLLLEWSAH
ncbi:MAG: phosphatidate cytidylyltransferase [Flavobacteriales bacterium]